MIIIVGGVDGFIQIDEIGNNKDANNARFKWKIKSIKQDFH